MFSGEVDLRWIKLQINYISVRRTATVSCSSVVLASFPIYWVLKKHGLF